MAITKTFTVTTFKFDCADTGKQTFESRDYYMLGEWKADKKALAVIFSDFVDSGILPYKITEAIVTEEKREISEEAFIKSSVTEDGKRKGVSYVMRTISKTKAMCKVIDITTGEMSERYVYADDNSKDPEKRRKTFNKANKAKHENEMVCFVGESITIDEKRYMKETDFYALSTLLK